jgi:NitT/TauT family transport system substrate-binding protein
MFNKMFLRERCLMGVTLALMALSLLSAHPAQAADRVREGLQIGGLGSLRVTLPATEAKYNLKYEIDEFSDSSAALLALDGGSIDIANTTSEHLVRAIDEGMDVVMVVGWGGGYNVLVASKKLPLKQDDWAGFKALAKQRAAAKNPLKIAVPTGSLQHLKLVYKLRAEGLNPDRDVDLINIPFADQPRALSDGEADMAMTLAVFGALAINNQSANLFSQLVGGDSGKQEIGFIVRGKDIRERPDYIQRIVDSHVDAMNTFLGNVDKQVQLEQQYSKLPKAVLDMQQRDFLKLDDRINVADIKKIAHQMYEQGWTKKDRSAEVDKYVDFSFLEKATGKNQAELSTW